MPRPSSNASTILRKFQKAAWQRALTDAARLKMGSVRRSKPGLMDNEPGATSPTRINCATASVSPTRIVRNNFGMAANVRCRTIE